MSRRFGSEKALAMAGERPLCQWILDRLKDVTDDLFLQMAPDATVPADLTAHYDIHKGRGPKSGIHGALINARYPSVFVVGSDMPNIDPALPTILRTVVATVPETDAVVPRWSNGWIEPLSALYSRSALPVILRQMGEERYKLSDLFDELDRVTYVEIDSLIESGVIDEDCFVNINSREALESWLEGRRD
jgi:molybdopterin-guanine dinucleotide biosynthesis protein A